MAGCGLTVIMLERISESSNNDQVVALQLCTYPKPEYCEDMGQDWPAKVIPMSCLAGFWYNMFRMKPTRFRDGWA